MTDHAAEWAEVQTQAGRDYWLDLHSLAYLARYGLAEHDGERWRLTPLGAWVAERELPDPLWS